MLIASLFQLDNNSMAQLRVGSKDSPLHICSAIEMNRVHTGTIPTGKVGISDLDPLILPRGRTPYSTSYPILTRH